MIKISAFIMIVLLHTSIIHCQFAGEYPADCDTKAAAVCEQQLYDCRLYTGPVGSETQCRCGTDFYGDCLRRAGCMLHKDPEDNMIYMRQCVNFIMKYDCQDTLICSINCASEGNINRTTTKIVPFNNYNGDYYLRLRICNHVVHPQKLNRYGIIYPATCSSMNEFQVCSRWIPPNSFVPVALPIDTTYLLVDYCSVYANGVRVCHESNPSPSRVYGNNILFPTTFDVPRSLSSICTTDDDCLGSFCDRTMHPNICSPKSLKHVSLSGSHYFDEPFS
mmetsp:Transcript_18298/g.18379  ORF Transcript_18298/g.18379 Transcript_18298/m.18379 type:complete len:277 (-) Transcript_18298:120-950(-)